MKKGTKCFLSLLLVVISYGNSYAQDDLLKEIDSSKAAPEKISAEFKALKIVNLPSTKMAAKKELYFLVSHRFGDLSKGFDNFFGLDSAITNIAFAYGITNWLTMEASRSTYQKTYDVAAKYKIASQQSSGMPVNIVGYSNVTINSALDPDINPNFKDFDQRLTFTNEVLISRKFSDKLTLELVPMHIHQNYRNKLTEVNDQFAVGVGGRFKITKRLSVNAEYVKKMVSPTSNQYKDPLSLGLDIETGGHVFQLLFSNSQPMNPGTYVNNANGDWKKGNIFFGFNMYRSF